MRAVAIISVVLSIVFAVGFGVTYRRLRSTQTQLVITREAVTLLSNTDDEQRAQLKDHVRNENVNRELLDAYEEYIIFLRRAEEVLCRAYLR